MKVQDPVDAKIVRVKQLSFSYGERVALKDIAFEIEKGELFGFLGPNGSGKSTLFHLLTSWIPCRKERIWLGEVDVGVHPAAARHKIGALFQSPSLDVQLTVRENLIFQGYFYGLHGTRLRKKVDELLEVLGVKDRASDRVKELSGGLKRRVEVAKCMLHDPEILIMDEPTVGMDPLARDQFWKTVQQLRDRTRVTTLVTSHLLQEMEQCDQIGILKEGQMLGVRSPDLWKKEFEGEETVRLELENPEPALDLLPQKWKENVIRLEQGMQITGSHLAREIPEVVSRLGENLVSITWSQPSLEDVFLKLNLDEDSSDQQLLTSSEFMKGVK